MTTTVGLQRDLDELVTKLIELDYDAIEAYDEAISRLENAEAKAKLTEFRDDHKRHTEKLAPFLSQHGRNVPNKGNFKRVLTKGKVVMAGLMGDKAILMAMKTNEEDTNTAYERAVNHKEAPASLREVFQSNLADERRHREWIVAHLGKL